ncbi:MAG: histidine kinase [Saprospiraceae bacterium]
MWAGGKDGLWKFENNDFIKRRYNHVALDRTISDMEIDENNILWCAVEGYEVGVVGLKSDTLYSIAGTANLKVNDLYTDKEGFLWVATPQGLLQFEINPNNFNDQQLIRKYTTSDGINTREVTAVYVDNQYIYAGTNKGLTQIDRNGKYGDNSTPTLYIKDIQVNGQSKHLANDYELPPLQNDLEIEFVALSYKSLEDITYSYQLKGVDEDWQETNRRSLRYPNLKPGNYSFHLKARDIDNNEVVLAEPIHFFIKTPLWDRTWFRILSVFLIVGIIWFIYKDSINIIKRKEEEKTRIAKQMAELEMKALQSQMNPHFVSNALASIRYYIQDNKADQAGDYLARFAKLMRLFLESSKSNFTTLEDEIKLISLYVEMEQLRFEEQFDFQLDIGEKIDVYFIQIPTLLLQPFVENAINHGLFHKDGKGKLKVEFRLCGEALLECIIEDDGIGQTAAKAISEKSSKGHKSRGMQIVRERLEVLKYKDDMDIEIEIVDLENAGVAVGTRVVLRIPFLK